jgi:hypothetical protein
VTPAAPDAVFVPRHQMVSLGPDLAGVNFHSYRSNALSIERLSGQTLRSVFAGAAGDTWRILVCTKLPTWLPYATNTVEASGLFEFFYDSTPATPVRFFRAEKL